MTATNTALHEVADLARNAAAQGLHTLIDARADAEEVIARTAMAALLQVMEQAGWCQVSIDIESYSFLTGAIDASGNTLDFSDHPFGDNDRVVDQMWPIVGNCPRRLFSYMSGTDNAEVTISTLRTRLAEMEQART